MTTPAIDHKIHQIWVGGRVPTELRDMMQTWRDHHPSWECKLWTDSEVAGLVDPRLSKHPMTNWSLYQRAESLVPRDAVGQFRADLLRYEILYREGGFYADADTICLQPIDDAVNGRDTFAAAEDANWIGNTYLGASQHHPVMLDLVEGCALAVARHKKGTRPNKLSGPQMLTPIWREHGGHVDPTDLWFAGGSYSHVKNGTVIEDYGDAYASHHWFHTRQVLRARGRTDV